ncbi:LysR family transcriptional regulator [Bradyrhizobium liaoningense]
MMNPAQLARIDVSLLVVFSTVLEERQVSRAADKLKLTPSAVSHGLARLRRIFHDPLFLKTPSGVKPTERALALAGPVAELLARLDAIVSAAEPFDARTARRSFTIGTPDALAAVFSRVSPRDPGPGGPGDRHPAAAADAATSWQAVEPGLARHALRA